MLVRAKECINKHARWKQVYYKKHKPTLSAAEEKILTMDKLDPQEGMYIFFCWLVKNTPSELIFECITHVCVFTEEKQHKGIVFSQLHPIQANKKTIIINKAAR